MITIVVNNFRDVSRLWRCLKSVFNTVELEHEVLVVDCMTIGLKWRLARRFPQVKLIAYDRDIGPAAQRAVGYERANSDSEFVVFLDNDTVVEADCLTTLTECLIRNPKIGLAQPRLLDFRNSLGDGVGGYLDPLFYASRHRNPGDIFRDGSETVLIPYAESAVLAMRRGILDIYPPQLRSFDPSYFILFEDVDLSLRVWLAGFEVVLVAGATAFNEWRKTGRERLLEPKHIRMNARNRLRTMLRIYSARNLLRFLPMTVVSEMLKSLALLRINRSHSLANLAGMLDVIRDIPNLISQHRWVQLHRKIPDDFLRSILEPLDLERLVHDFKRHYQQVDR